jgi:decaprenylphospho-beta-D-erythro-pentofuranosid-2-ulose 2-reductase
MTTSSAVLILGATSDIARATAAAYAATGRPVILAGRDVGQLERDAVDLRIRSKVEVRVVALDVLTVDPAAFFDGLPLEPATVVLAVGLLGEQKADEQSGARARLILESNFVGPALLLEEAARRLAARGAGTIVGISSVAGDRGRASNYLYGSAKAGLSAYLSGLRNRLHAAGVRVITVKPGFTRTRMTEGMKLPPALTAEPGEVARAILKAESGKADVIYVRPIWRLVMAIITAIPEPVFKKLKL